jgi:Lon protease-like protein
MSKPVPMFPLPNYFLFPGALAPLHIFEPRYRQMINDLLDGPGRLAMASLALPSLSRFDPAQPNQRVSDPGGISAVRDAPAEGQEPPPVFPIGGLAEIVHHEPFKDGRFLIWILGLGRVRLHEVPSDRLYRKVQVEPLPDVPCSDEDQRRLRTLLEVAIESRSGKDVALADDMSIGALADILLQALKLTPDQLREIYPETSAARRAERALAWLPIKP